MYAPPAWQTEELDEEWPETSVALSSPGASTTFLPDAVQNSSSTGTLGRHDKVTSLRASVSNANGSPQQQQPSCRVVSGHTHESLGSLLAPPPVGLTRQDAERERRRASQGGAQLSPPSSCAGGSLSSSSSSRAGSSLQSAPPPAGTFLVRAVSDSDEAGEQPKHLRNPFLAKGPAAGELFQPLALESMFQPPTPPLKSVQVTVEDELDEEQVDQEPRAQSWIEKESQKDTPERSTSPTSSPPPQLPFSSTTDIRRTSHSYVPRRPSRLSESMSPEKDSASEASEQAAELPELPELSFDQSVSSPKQQDSTNVLQSPLRFSGRQDSMKDIDFTFSPPPRTNSSLTRLDSIRGSGFLEGDASSSTPQGKAPLKLFRLSDAIQVQPVNDAQGLETPLAGHGSAGRRQRRGQSSQSPPWGQEDSLDNLQPLDGLEDQMEERPSKRIRLYSESTASDQVDERDRSGSRSFRSGSFRVAHRIVSSSSITATSHGSQESYSLRDQEFASLSGSRSSLTRSSLLSDGPLQFNVGTVGEAGEQDSASKPPGKRGSWEERGAEMLQLIRNRWPTGENKTPSLTSPSTVTGSTSRSLDPSNESVEADGSLRGTVQERSGESSSVQVYGTHL